MKKILFTIILIASFLANTVYAGMTTVPVAPGTGYLLVSTSTGLYNPIASSTLLKSSVGPENYIQLSDGNGGFKYFNGFLYDGNNYTLTTGNILDMKKDSDNFFAILPNENLSTVFPDVSLITTGNNQNIFFDPQPSNAGYGRIEVHGNIMGNPSNTVNILGGVTDACNTTTIDGYDDGNEPPAFIKNLTVGDKVFLYSASTTLATVMSVPSMTQFTTDIPLGDCSIAQQIGKYTGSMSIFDYNGNSRLVVNPNGYVGINKANPSNQLDVVGTSTFSGRIGVGTSTPAEALQVNGNILVGSPTVSTPSLKMMSSANPGLNRTILSVDGTGTYLYSYDNDASDGIHFRGLAGATGDLMFLGAGTNYLGRLGIGTSSPSAKLSVHDMSGAVGTTPVFTVASSTANSLSTTTLLTVIGNGRVGIGSPSPAAGLDVSAPASLDAMYVRATNGYQILKFLDLSGVSRAWVGNDSGSRFQFKNFTSGGDLYLTTTGAGNVIVDNGKVGIGTTSPSQMLTVGNNNQFTVTSSGNVSAAGSITSGGAGGAVLSIRNALADLYVAAGTSLSYWNGSAVVPGLVALNTGMVGIGTTTPNSKVTVENGDVYIASSTRGIILKSPNGSCFRTTVTDLGALTVSLAITCP